MVSSSRKSNKKYKYSISGHFILAFVVVMVITLMLCLAANKLFIERYYLINKENVLVEAYNVLNEADSVGTIADDEFDNELRLICDRYSLDILVVDTESQTVQYMGKDSGLLKRSLWDHIFADEIGYVGPQEDEEQNAPRIARMPIPNEENFKRTILVETDNYTMGIFDDLYSGGKYVDMWGDLTSGNLFIIRSAFESIKDSVSIANRFLSYIGLVAIIISSILIIFVSKMVTRPILELADISERMTKLDFEAKYRGKGNNEITLLGDNINKLSESLEQTISELKSANIELQKDVERKNEIDAMRKEFLSNVSHELKTPIALIQGYAEGLQEGIADDPDSMAYYLEVINDEAFKMNEMVKKLLTLNQLEFNNEAVVMKRFDIVSLISGIIETTDILFKRNDITVSFPDSMPIYAWGDEFMVEEILVNFISNAINHCDNEKKIDISLDETDGKVKVNVFNTGTPIPEESIDRVWEKFYKVDKARTRAYGGSGVGLSIVAAMCKAMNMKYGVTNFVNGVDFWIELDRQ